MADPVLVTLIEGSAGAPLRFQLDTASASVIPAADTSGKSLPVIDAYAIRNLALVKTATNAAIGMATELLGQVRVAGNDLVVVRQEHKSYANPLHWFSALAGHPIQVSRITWYLVATDGSVRSGSFVSKPASYRWSVELSTPAGEATDFSSPEPSPPHESHPPPAPS